jgi:hypothetical protein
VTVTITTGDTAGDAAGPCSTVASSVESGETPTAEQPWPMWPISPGGIGPHDVWEVGDVVRITDPHQPRRRAVYVLANEDFARDVWRLRWPD